MKRTAWDRRHAAIGAFFVLLPLLLFAPALFGGGELQGWDIRVLDVPFKEMLRQAIGRGELPLWMPDILGGVPAAGNPNVQFFYPTEALKVYLGIPTYLGFALETALHVAIAGLGMLCFLRALGLGLGASFLGAFFFAVSGSQISGCYGGYSNFTKAVALVPWAFWGVQRAWDAGAWSGWAVAGACLGLQVLGDGSQIAAYLAPALAAYAVHLGLRSQGPSAGKAWSRAAAGLTLMLAFAAVISAPTSWTLLRNLPYSDRQSIPLHMFNEGAWGPSEAITWIVPGFYAWKHPFYDGYMGVNFMSAYLGLLPWALAAAAYAHGWKKEPLLRWLAGLALVAYLLATGPGFNLSSLLYHLPVYSGFRIWSRILFLVTFAVCVAAAFGWERLRQGGDRRAVNAALAFCAAAFALSGMAWFWAEPDAAAMLRSAAVLDRLAPVELLYRKISSLAHASALRSLLLLPALAALLWLVGRGRVLGAALVLVVAFHAVDQWQVAAEFLTYSAPGASLSGLAPARALLPPQGTGDWRIDSTADAAPNDPILYGQQNIQGRYSMQLKSSVRMEKAMQARRADWLDLWSVRWAMRRTAEGPKAALRVRALPRARLLSRSRVAASDEEAYRLLADPAFDVRTVAALPLDPALPGGPVRGTVQWLQRWNTVSRLKVQTPQKALLLVAEAWHPGWQASVDGQPASLLKANGGMQAVVVEAGEHQVELRYSLALVRAALGASALGVLLLLGVFWLDRKRLWGARSADA